MKIFNSWPSMLHCNTISAVFLLYFWWFFKWATPVYDIRPSQQTRNLTGKCFKHSNWFSFFGEIKCKQKIKKIIIILNVIVVISRHQKLKIRAHFRRDRNKFRTTNRPNQRIVIPMLHSRIIKFMYQCWK